MSGTLHIDFTPGEGAIIRALGLIERRGFELRDVAAEGRRLTVAVEPRGPGRQLDVLRRQLERLVDVTAVQIISAPAGQPA
ncbi:acetolactate synthase 3 regulatory subunit domain protein [Sphingomonas ginkgonis]|uniref:Acetolactate synthase 3 regulatory subunit domain protein n=1 Tax=Sphingomonas ginkgonis TaxID=2315330 RepID=A0A3R9YGL6_9SPHN|nr:ACT domain-containing protein [Sphingomonas ginkgonis]RST29479.1 acetolactate synthase 3 regulatory subunit domain protein [Sphingomonas ginkgonis]